MRRRAKGERETRGHGSLAEEYEIVAQYKIHDYEGVAVRHMNGMNESLAKIGRKFEFSADHRKVEQITEVAEPMPKVS